jgi:HAD superfamily hydrolase (TIGR01450 family)
MSDLVRTDDATPGEPLQRLRQIEGFIFDMDGTLVLGDRQNHGLRPLPGAVELTQALDRRGIPFAVFTNGTTRPPAKYAEILRTLGIPVPDSNMLTPASAAVAHFTYAGHHRVMVLGGEGLAEPLRSAGLETVPRTHDSGADAVLAGWFREMTFPDLEAACDAVWHGARFYSSSASRFFATTTGRTLGTSRIISAAIHDATGVDIEIVGKPSRHALNAAAARLGVDPHQIAVVGDDPELEMAMARAGGTLAIAVGTGLHDVGYYATLPPDQQPDLSLTGVDALLDLYLS